MKAYLGIDIGTTNTKALLLGQNGFVLWSDSCATPHLLIEGVEYFSLQGIENIVDRFIQSASEMHSLRGVAFSSIGESVVPVKGGKAIGDPLMWYEANAHQTQDEGEILKRWAKQEITGLPYSDFYSAGKMLWMRKRMKQIPDYWLPLTTYMVWRKTGYTGWDNSQACRSYLYDIHKRQWIAPLLDALSLKAPGTLDYMGAQCGERDGITYGLGGHDHITGLHAIYDMQGDMPFLYDSMGTSSVLAALTNADRDTLKAKDVYNAPDGCVVSGFKENEYIVTRSFRHYGGLLSTLMKLGGIKGPRALYALNTRIREEVALAPGALFANYGDIILGYQGKDALSVFDLAPGTSIEHLIACAYLYLGVAGSFLCDELLNVIQPHQPYYAGGGMTENALLMEIKATAIERDINLLNISEIGALGAALIAAGVCGDQSAVRAAAEAALNSGTTVHPNKQWISALREDKKRYGELRIKLNKQYQ